MAICDSQIYFSRDVKVYVKIGANIWEIPVLDGFSWSQSNNSSEVTLAEMESATGVSRRGKKVFNDSLAPAEWSFSTYARPFVSVFGNVGGEADQSAANVHAVEEVLWALAAGKAYRESSTFKSGAGGTAYYTLGTVGNGSIFDFDTSNTATLGTASIFFVLKTAGLTYEVTSAVVNEVTMNFDIDGIATLEWSGMGSNVIDSNEPVATIYEAINSTTNFIRNRLTQLTCTPVNQSMKLEWDAVTLGVPGATVNIISAGSGYEDGVGLTFDPSNATGCTITYTVSGGAVTAASSAGGTGVTGTADVPILGSPQSGIYPGTMPDSYSLTLTGGSITLSNNITYITPEEIGKVNIPFAHVTGTRSISGSFTNYLVTDNLQTDQSADFWEDLKALTTVITHDFALTFKVGGTGTPRLEFAMPHCHIEIPTHSVEDVISIETNFSGLGTCINDTDELTVKYVA